MLKEKSKFEFHRRCALGLAAEGMQPSPESFKEVPTFQANVKAFLTNRSQERTTLQSVGMRGVRPRHTGVWEKYV